MEAIRAEKHRHFSSRTLLLAQFPPYYGSEGANGLAKLLEIMHIRGK